MGPMGIDDVQGRKLTFNETLTYRAGWPAAQNPQAPAQPAGQGPYTGRVVDFTDWAIGVRADSWWGQAPLYYVFPEDILRELVSLVGEPGLSAAGSWSLLESDNLALIRL